MSRECHFRLKLWTQQQYENPGLRLSIFAEKEISVLSRAMSLFYWKIDQLSFTSVSEKPETRARSSFSPCKWSALTLSSLMERHFCRGYLSNYHFEVNKTDTVKRQWGLTAASHLICQGWSVLIPFTKGLLNSTSGGYYDEPIFNAMKWKSFGEFLRSLCCSVKRNNHLICC